MSNKAIGIDLGTTYSCVGVYNNNKVEIIPNEMGMNTTPSVVSFEGKERLIGQAAKDQITKNYKNTIYDAKRLIGRRYTDKTVKEDMKKWPFKIEKDENSDRPVIVVEYLNEIKKFFPEEISSMVLGKMKKIAEDYLSTSITDAIITVPAYFNDSQRQSTKDAGRIAGLNVMRIINEPTAAAIAYGLDNKSDNEKTVLVFDLGGGTFDVSILVLNEETFEVKSTSGNTHLGGEDFDNRLMQFCIEKFKEDTDVNIELNQKALRRLKQYCENAKRALSSAIETTIEIENLAEDEDLNVIISRAEFEEKCKDLFEKCFESIKQAMEEAGLSKNEIDDIVLVGGSSRIPKIQEMIKQFFNGKELCKNINPDEAVAYGAAYQAAVLNANEYGDDGLEKLVVDENEGLEKLVLVDVTPLSLGIEVQGGIMSNIINKNTPIPIKKVKKYKTTVKDQSEAKITIYQGERKLVQDNVKIGDFTVKIKGRGPAGSIKFNITFEVDVNSVLNVSAVEIKENVTSECSVIAEKMQMSEELIEKKIEEAKKFKEQDQKNVEAIRERINLENMCYSYKQKTNSNQMNVINEILRWLKNNKKNLELNDIIAQKEKLLNAFK